MVKVGDRDTRPAPFVFIFQCTIRPKAVGYRDARSLAAGCYIENVCGCNIPTLMMARARLSGHMVALTVAVAIPVSFSRRDSTNGLHSSPIQPTGRSADFPILHYPLVEVRWTKVDCCYTLRSAPPSQVQLGAVSRGTTIASNLGESSLPIDMQREQFATGTTFMTRAIGVVSEPNYPTLPTREGTRVCRRATR
jgi:hypothetical protein